LDSGRRNVEYYHQNPDKYIQRISAYRKTDHGRFVTNSNSRKRNGSKQRALAMPFWADKKEMAIIYKRSSILSKKTGTSYETDHIVPIKHKLVCGLHVPANLQTLTKAANRSKGNRVSLETLNLYLDFIGGRIKNLPEDFPQELIGFEFQ
jgi:5-methylcytosine-specific restriction endonuclease McrA